MKGEGVSIRLIVHYECTRTYGSGIAGSSTAYVDNKRVRGEGDNELLRVEKSVLLLFHGPIRGFAIPRGDLRGRSPEIFEREKKCKDPSVGVKSISSRPNVAYTLVDRPAEAPREKEGVKKALRLRGVRA